MKKKCLSCGAQFALSGSGKRQKYCSKCARRGDGRVRGLPGSNPLKTKPAKTVREQVLAQRDKPNPISFITPDGRKGRVWLGAAGVGDDRHWRVNLKDLPAEKQCGFTDPRKATADIIRIEGKSHIPLTRLNPDPPARDLHASNRTFGPDRGATKSGSTSKRKRSFRNSAAGGEMS